MVSGQIIESFQISGRGTAIVIDAKTKLPVSRSIRVIIQQHDGSLKEFDAWKEYLLRSARMGIEVEAFAIIGAAPAEVPVGALVTLQVADA